MELINLSGFPAERMVAMNGAGEEIVLIVAKATYDLRHQPPILAEKPEPVRLADEYFGEPAETSVEFASDTALFKPAAEVILQGCAFPANPGDTQVDVRLQVGPVDKTVRVFGERLWEKSLGAHYSSKPKPIEKVPLIYERAYGGTDLSNPTTPDGTRRNPVGKGFRSKKSKLPLENTPLPNLEDPAKLVKLAGDRPQPKCFAPLASDWSPRAEYAGTYDEQWQQTRMPLLPDDFDERFWFSAPEDQILDDYLRGGEDVEVTGATPNGSLRFSIPRTNIVMAVRVGEERIEPDCVCDTAVIDTERMLLTLTWRASVSVHGRIADVLWIEVLAGEVAHVG